MNRAILCIIPILLAIVFGAAWFVPLPYSMSNTTMDNPAFIADRMLGVVKIEILDDKTRGMGAGFFIGENSIITAYHIVESKTLKAIKVSGYKGMRWFDAEVVGFDEPSDVAILRIKDWDGYTMSYPWTPLRFSDNNNLMTGSLVWVIGHPLGLDWTVAKGIVSNAFRHIFFRNDSIFVQVDANLYPGNSGGPVLNKAGEVIGMSDLVYLDPSPNSRGSYGLATDSRILARSYGEIVATGKVFHEHLGCSFQRAEEDGLIRLIARSPLSPCSIYDFKIGDQIASFQSEATGGIKVQIKDFNDVLNWLSLVKEHEVYTIVIMRDEISVDLQITAVSEPSE